jgi:glycerophosphoryl diester phosphodiesterase
VHRPPPPPPPAPPPPPPRGASAAAPENTLAAFTLALRAGADALELDVRLTRDGAPVILHDATLERTTTGRGPLAGVDLADLRRLDAGSWFAPRFRGERVPTLGEVLDLARGRCGLNLELKIGGDGAHHGRGRRLAPETADLARAVARTLARSAFGELLVVSSFSRAALTAARAAMPRVRLGLLASRTSRGLSAAHGLLALWSFHPHRRLCTPRRIVIARRLGLRVLVWPVNDVAGMRRLAAMGVDGIMTDDPALARAGLRAAS